MWQVIIYIIAVLSAIIILISIHEFGHYLSAKYLGVKVLRFVIGFGKPLFSYRTKSGIEYCIGRIPLGGFVKLLDTRHSDVSESDLKHAFDQQPLWKQFIVIISGAITNIIFAILLFWLLFILGVVRPIPMIDSVTPDSLVAQAGIHAGQEIIAIDHQKTTNWSSIAMALVMRIGDTGTLHMRLKENKTITNYKISLKEWQLDPYKLDPVSSLGIIPKYPVEHPDVVRIEKYSVLPALSTAIVTTWSSAKFNVVVLKKIITGKISIKSLAGPISLFRGMALAFEHGFIVFLNVLAVLSITLAVVNLLPIPGLDGGHILYLFYELISGKPVTLAVQLLAFRLSFIVFCVLLVQVSVNDLLRLM